MSGNEDAQDGDESLPDVNHRLQYGNKEVVDEKQVAIEEDDLIVNGSSEDVKGGRTGLVCGASTALQLLQQQPQNGVVCWQRFLHVRTLRVLLVENDDCTRHIITALLPIVVTKVNFVSILQNIILFVYAGDLLPKCHGTIIEAANGLQAWKILEDMNNHIDIVLTEVVMPCLNGIGLLCKIMSHITRKNVPVITMSSHDSIGLVFACLSKGAVDFLVKPVRKNELKNLWQHVWRRCHSSSGSGSESGTQTQKSVKSKGIEKSDNNTGSNDEDDDRRIGLNVGDGSDDGSGTQSSWTKQAVEVDSFRPASPWDQVTECPDSTCAQVIHSNAEASGNKCVPITAVKDGQENGEQLENNLARKDLGIDLPRKVELKVEYPEEIQIKIAGTEQVDKRRLDLNVGSPSDKLESGAANLTSNTTKTSNLQNTDFEAPNGLSKILDHNDKAINDAKESPSFELGLKRFRVEDSGPAVREERNVLRRSNSSAFSRYNTSSSTVNKAPSVNVKTASALVNFLEMTKNGSMCDVHSQSINEPPNQCSNASSNNIDMVSITNNSLIKPAVLKNSSGDDVVATAVLDQPRGVHKEVQAQFLQHHCDNHFHVSGNIQQQPREHADLSLKKMAAAALHCQSPNVLCDQGNAGYYSVNKSGSGSNQGSNEPNGSSAAGNAGGANGESDNGIAGKSGSGDARGSIDASPSGTGVSGTVNRIDLEKSAHRKAALTKFRQKRNERCFQKKVRYQNRKKLAEQRHRVRGQFVRQSGNEITSSGTDKTG